MGGVNEKTLNNGNKVHLASWEHLTPPDHGLDLQSKTWNDSSPRKDMRFYDSTVEYMRNDWATQNMRTVHATLGGKQVLLFHSPTTDTWHTTDALDIDHKTPWKQHLLGLGVNNGADALMAYNDVGNLRMLPSVHNRARDSADDLLRKHGQDSPQWKEWVKERFAFDNSIQIRDFDPETDGARRTKTTLNQTWTEENTRSELKFDKKVVEQWFESELKRQYAGSVNITSDDGGTKWQVPLFRCAATGQLVTRDAFDIDHVVPFEQLNRKMLELHPNGVSKADALNAYNDTSNLRLVGRSANSSHEWEIVQDGGYRDKVAPKIRGEFDGFIEKSGPMDPQVQQRLREAIVELRVGQQMMTEQHWAKTHAPSMQPPPQTLQHGMPQPVGPLLSHSSHTDHPMYQKILSDLTKLDPQQRVFTAEQRETMASSLVVMAKHHGMSGIDRVQGFDDHGKPSIKLSFDNGGMSAPQMTWLSVEEGLKNRSVTANTGALELMAHHREQVAQSLNTQRSQTVDVQLPPPNDPGQTGQNPHGQTPSNQGQGGPPRHL